MRHHNPISTSRCHSYRNTHMTSPYQKYGSYKKPDIHKTYVKTIQMIYDNPGIKRAEILHKMGYYKTLDQAKKIGRGQCSCMFADLLYQDFIDYDKSYRYYVTEKGLRILVAAYQNKMMKIIMPKQMTFNFM